MADDKKLPPDHDHWLASDAAIRNLWILLIAVFVLSIVAEIVWHPHPHFTMDAIFGFGAWFGLLTAFALVVVTKSWAIFVKRKDTYYD